MRSFFSCVAALILATINLALLARSVPAAEVAPVPAALQGFAEMALWHDNQNPVPIRKWVMPMRVKIIGNASSGLKDFARERVETMAALAGLNAIFLKPEEEGENFVYEFAEGIRLRAGDRDAGCLSRSWWNGKGEVTRVVVTVKLDYGIQFLKSCISHELMHAFGFPGHPHSLETILSYTNRYYEMTPLDRQSLKILYNAAIKPGMHHGEALQMARRVVLQQLNISDGENDGTNGWQYIRSSFVYLGKLRQESADKFKGPVAVTEVGLISDLVKRADTTAGEKAHWEKLMAELGVSTIPPVASGDKKP